MDVEITAGDLRSFGKTLHNLQACGITQRVENSGESQVGLLGFVL
jgi:hypothetical protein